MPALYSLGQHAALEEVQNHLQDGEVIFAYLDDVYALCDPPRVKAIFDLIQDSLLRRAGIQINLGKTRIWNARGIKPDLADEIDSHAWTGEHEAAE